MLIHKSLHSTVGIQDKSEKIAKFFVVEKRDISLLGKITAMQLGVLKIGLSVNHVKETAEFPKIKNIQIKLAINKSVHPLRQPLRRVPISVEPAIEKKLEEAVRLDIIEPVTEPSEWVSPILVLFKKSGEIRICVDMRRANEAIERENYPVTTFETLMTKLRGAQFFSKLDLLSAYHQLELHADSREITTFITHEGIFRYKRLMFGVNAAPGSFQRVLCELLAACLNCINFMDDMLVYGKTEKEHDESLAKVLTTFRENNVTLNEDKCEKKVREVEWLGHKLSFRGINAE